MDEKSKQKPHACFKRMETDAEFKERLYKLGARRGALALAGLDEWAYGEYKAQRRIVEDVA